MPRSVTDGGTGFVAETALRPSDWLPSWVVAIDGSKQEEPIRKGFPGAEVSYVSVASVMINVERMRALDQARPIDPHEFNKLTQADAVDSVFPGCNVVLKGEGSAPASLRAALLETLQDTRMSQEGETLLDTYEALLAYKPTTQDQSCPYDDCQKADRKFSRGDGCYKCECSHERKLYSTDALRIHEGMNSAGPNGAMFAEIMQVLERIWLVHILRTIEQRNWFSSLKRLALVIDGPLAVFGHPAWLSEAIEKEICRINGLARERNGQDLLVLGIEKTGAFATHLQQLDINSDGAPGRIAPQSAMLLTDSYIKQNIVFSDSQKPYGSQTYFGRKFFYKTKSGALIVGVLPYFEDAHRDLTTAQPTQFPRIADALNLLDQLVSVRYPHAVVPLIEAHAEAAIPMNLGQRILEQLARDLVDGR